jgi:DNA repair protein SbcC/Rad50
MIIKKIELKNFQSHRNTTIELAALTALTGPSSSGKSAVERGLSWLFYNDWDKTFPQDPDEPTAVAITLADGTVIARFRKGEKNRAAIKVPGQNPQKFKDFGEEVPGIFDLVNVREIKVAKRKINLNFSRQHDGLFMIGESRPAKAQWLSRLYGANVVNGMLRMMAADKKDAEKELKGTQDDLERASVKLEGFRDLEAQESALAAASGLLKSLQDLYSMRDQIVDIKAAIDSIRSRYWLVKYDFDSLRDKLHDLGDLSDLNSKLDVLTTDKLKLSERRHILGYDFKKLKVMVEELQDLRDINSALIEQQKRQVVIDRSRPILDADPGRIRRMLADLEELKIIRMDLDEASEDLEQARAGILALESKHEALGKTLKEVLLSDGRCPVCSMKPRKPDPTKMLQNIRALSEV